MFNGRVTVRMLPPLSQVFPAAPTGTVCPACGSINVFALWRSAMCDDCSTAFSLVGIRDHSGPCDHCAVHMSFNWANGRPQHCDGCVDGSRLVQIGRS